MARRPRNATKLWKHPQPRLTYTAVREWRDQLAQSPALGRDQLDELEAHLYDAMGDLQTRGLSPEEAFLIAAKRAGTSSALGNEFGNEPPSDLAGPRVLDVGGQPGVLDHLQRAGSVWLWLGGIGILSTWWHGRRGAHQHDYGYLLRGRPRSDLHRRAVAVLELVPPRLVQSDCGYCPQPIKASCGCLQS